MGINNRGQTECMKSMRGRNGPQGKIQGQRISKIPIHETELCQVEQLLEETRFPTFLPIKSSSPQFPLTRSLQSSFFCPELLTLPWQSEPHFLHCS